LEKSPGIHQILSCFTLFPNWQPIHGRLTDNNSDSGLNVVPNAAKLAQFPQKVLKRLTHMEWIWYKMQKYK